MGFDTLSGCTDVRVAWGHTQSRVEHSLCAPIGVNVVAMALSVRGGVEYACDEMVLVWPTLVRALVWVVLWDGEVAFTCVCDVVAERRC